MLNLKKKTLRDLFSETSLSNAVRNVLQYKLLIKKSMR